MGLLKWLFGRKKEEESFHPDYSKEDVDATKAETSRTAPKISLQATQKKHNMSLNKYEVKAVYKATNRSRTRTIYAKNEDDVKAQMVDYNDPDSIKEIPYDPPSQRQLAFASELKIHIPSVCCKEDMTALISEALRKEHQEFSGKPWKRVPPGRELLRFADSKHIPYSLYAEEFTVIRDCYMLHLKDDMQRVAFMIACMYRHINGGWNFCKWDQWLKDAEDLLADGSFYKSLVNNIGLDDGFQGFDYHDTISSRTKLYQMIADKAK